MIGKNSERPSLTGQTVGMIEYRYEKVRNPYQTLRMIEFRCEKSQFTDETTGMVGNRYQNVRKAHQTPDMVRGDMKKVEKCQNENFSKLNFKIFSKY